MVDQKVASGQYAYEIRVMTTAGQFPACASLFDGDVEGVENPPLAFFADAVLAALSAADPKGRTRSRLMTGLPMLQSLAKRTIAVRASQSSSGHTESHDLNTYKYVVWEWLDSLRQSWSSIDPEAGSAIFRLHTGECVTLVTLDPAIRG